MNGVPLDLEGKVNEEQGIRRNCTGQCLNATIPCRNSGQCIEGYASYTCDCNNTAFDGFYCHKGESAHACLGCFRTADPDCRTEHCDISASLFSDIGAYFELGSWLRYNIRKKPVSDEAAWANWIDPHYDNFSLGYNDTADDIEFSFSTVYKPAVLLYISSFVQDYIAVILTTEGESWHLTGSVKPAKPTLTMPVDASAGTVDLRYKLGLITHKYQLTNRNLADGFPHYINITRHNRTIKTQVRALTAHTL